MVEREDEAAVLLSLWWLYGGSDGSGTVVLGDSDKNCAVVRILTVGGGDGIPASGDGIAR